MSHCQPGGELLVADYTWRDDADIVVVEDTVFISNSNVDSEVSA